MRDSIGVGTTCIEAEEESIANIFRLSVLSSTWEYGIGIYYELSTYRQAIGLDYCQFSRCKSQGVRFGLCGEVLASYERR